MGRAGTLLAYHWTWNLAGWEGHDPKGLYAKARAGVIKDFTGISSPYEVPEAPELRVDTGALSLEASVAAVIALLEQNGTLSPPA